MPAAEEEEEEEEEEEVWPPASGTVRPTVSDPH